MEYETVSKEWPTVSRATLAALTIVATNARKLHVPEEKYATRARVETVLQDAGFALPKPEVNISELLDAANATQSAAWADEIEIGGFFTGAAAEATAYTPQIASGQREHLVSGAVAGLIAQAKNRSSRFPRRF